MHLEICGDLTAADLEKALGSRDLCAALLRRMSTISAPNTGVPAVVSVFAALGSAACDWIDGDLAIEMEERDERTNVMVMTELGAGIASVLNATTPFWTLIVANVMTADEKLSWNKLAGIGLGIAGTAAMVGPGVLAGLGGPVWPKFALIGASLSYAFALMVARQLKSVPPPVLATGQLTASTVIPVRSTGCTSYSSRASFSSGLSA